MRSVFTFGPDQVHPGKVDDPNKQVVMVSAPAWVDRRGLFMEWLGDNSFSSEYTQKEFDNYESTYGPMTVARRITVVEL